MKNFTSNSQKIGELGEDVACKYLVKHGFSILERNYTRKWGEIDIIAKKGDIIYFIEVKSKQVDSNFDFYNLTKQSDETNRPEENMHPQKMQRLRRVVETYLINRKVGSVDWQFDLLVVYLDMHKRLARVKNIDNVIL
jgi:putative endonuclease